jgi:hypothetical protein
LIQSNYNYDDDDDDDDDDGDGDDDDDDYYLLLNVKRNVINGDDM